MIKINAPQKNHEPAKSAGKANIPPPITVPAITMTPQNEECLVFKLLSMVHPLIMVSLMLLVCNEFRVTNRALVPRKVRVKLLSVWQ